MPQVSADRREINAGLLLLLLLLAVVSVVRVLLVVLVCVMMMSVVPVGLDSVVVVMT